MGRISKAPNFFGKIVYSQIIVEKQTMSVYVKCNFTELSHEQLNSLIIKYLVYPDNIFIFS